MKIIIAGGRDFNDYSLLSKVCDLIVSKEDEIVSGGQKTKTPNGIIIGADYFGEVYATKNGNNIKRFSADWNNLGKSAGPVRNEQMAKYADVLLAFWDGKSKGTKNMIELAKKHNLITYVVRY